MDDFDFLVELDATAMVDPATNLALLNEPLPRYAAVDSMRIGPTLAGHTGGCSQEQR